MHRAAPRRLGGLLVELILVEVFLMLKIMVSESLTCDSRLHDAALWYAAGLVVGVVYVKGGARGAVNTQVRGRWLVSV